MALTINGEEIYPSSLTSDPHVLTVTVDGREYHIKDSAIKAKKLRLRDPEGNPMDISPELEAKIFEAIADAKNNKAVLDAQGSLEYGNQNKSELLPHEPIDNNLRHVTKNYFDELSYRLKTNPSSIALLGKYTIPAIAASALLPWLGEAAASTSIAGIPATTWANTAATAGFAGHGLNHWLNEGINGWGDAAITALELAPLGKLAKPLYKSTVDIANSAYSKLPWTYRIPENSNMAYRRMGPLERDWLMEGNELSTRETNALTEAEEEAARAVEKKGRRFSLFKAGAEHGGRKQFAKGQPWTNTTVTHGEEQVLAIPGEGLPWVSGRHFHGPQGEGFRVGDISFEEAPFGSHIDLLTKEGYTGVNPSLLDGSVIYSPYKIFGHNFGYKKLYPKNATLLDTPQITSENAVNMTPEQWTAAQDAAVARGDMAEAQRLRDLHFKVSAPNTQILEGDYPLKVSHATDIDFNTFDKNYWKYGAVGKGNYFGNGQSVFSHLPIRKDFYINQRKPLVLDDAGREALFEDATTMPNDIINRGYDGVIVNYGPKHLSDFEMVEYNPNQIKLADAVTYDNNGVRIPLGERDNFNINDLRYGLLPFLGLGTAGALYGNLK